MPKPYYKVVMYADESGVLSASAVREKMGIEASSLKKYLRALMREGLIERLEEDKYVLTDLGKALKRSLENLRGNIGAPKYVVTDPSSNREVPLQFSNYKQLLAIIENDLVDRRLLEQHLQRGYIAEWASSGLGDEFLRMLIRGGAIKSLDDLANYIRSILSVIEA
ncbi:MAG: winged helix-turn-helix domain-containing protein [Desulfurococcaceae archaeon]